MDIQDKAAIRAAVAAAIAAGQRVGGWTATAQSQDFAAKLAAGVDPDVRSLTGYAAWLQGLSSVYTRSSSPEQPFMWLASKVLPDGTTREHDGYGDGGRRRYTCYVWNMVSTELVIVHDASVSGVDSFTGQTDIVWRPQQVTPAQIATVERLEGENGLGGTFEVDPSLVAKRAQMMDEIRKEILRVSPEENVQDLKFLNVSSADGYQTRHENPRRLVNWANPFSASCEGREAQIVKAVRCADGMVEFLAYEKWGTTNLNVRWRPLTDEEKAAPKAEAKPANNDEVKSSLDALKAKFGKKR